MRRIHPIARLGVARIFMENMPDITPDEAVAKATRFIQALHLLDLEIGPMGAFGPQDKELGFDALDIAADLIERDWGRKPWLPQ